MRKTLTIIALSIFAFSAHASLADVAAKAKAIEVAKDELKAAKKSLSPVEKAELRLQAAQRSLEKAKTAKPKAAKE